MLFFYPSTNLKTWAFLKNYFISLVGNQTVLLVKRARFKTNSLNTSGKNGKQWCKEQKLSYQYFTYWKKTLLVEQDASRIASQFTELIDEPLETKDSGIKIQCNDLLLHVEVDFNSETLRRLILLLQRAFPC